VRLGLGVLESAAELTGTHGLRTYDAVQLTCALAAGEVDPDCNEFACYDENLRAAAAARGPQITRRSRRLIAAPEAPNSAQRAGKRLSRSRSRRRS
jgi:hypothetical protein